VTKLKRDCESTSDWKLRTNGHDQIDLCPQDLLSLTAISSVKTLPVVVEVMEVIKLPS